MQFFWKWFDTLIVMMIIATANTITSTDDTVGVTDTGPAVSAIGIGIGVGGGCAVAVFASSVRTVS